MTGDYPELHRKAYICADGGVAQFIPVCPICARFVKADLQVWMNEHGEVRMPNATCSRCGRVNMPFEGYF